MEEREAERTGEEVEQETSGGGMMLICGLSDEEIAKACKDWT